MSSDSGLSEGDLLDRYVEALREARTDKVHRLMSQSPKNYDPLIYLESYLIGLDNDRSMRGISQQVCAKLHEDFPDNFEIYDLLCDMIMDAGSNCSSVVKEHIRKIFDFSSIYTSDYAGLIRSGNVAQWMGDLDLALKYFSDAHEVNPEGADAIFRMWCIGQEINDNALKSLKLLERNSGSVKHVDFKNFRQAQPNEYKSWCRSKDNGCLILSGVFEKDELADFDDRMENFRISRAIHHSVTLSKEELTTELNSTISHLKDLIDERVAANLSEWRRSGWMKWENPAVHAQCSFPAEKGIILHEDRPTQAHRQNWTTFWVPLRENGPRVAPSLSLLPYNVGVIGIKLGNNTNSFNAVEENVFMEFFGDYFVALSVPVGSVLMFGPHVFHYTHTNPEMPKHRLSIDFRFSDGPFRFSEKFC